MVDQTIKVLTVDDHVLIHEAIGALIDATDGLKHVGSATTGARGARLVRELQPDVVVVDVSLSDMNGLMLAQRVLAEVPGLSVIVLSMHEDRAYVQRALEIGAKAYVSKRSEGSHLIQAIRAAAQGGVYIDPAVAQQLLNGNSKQPFSLHATGSNLTDREANVVRLIALGYTAKEIAGQLGVTVKSVETYKARACEKLDMKTRTQLVRYAATQGWLAPL